MGKPEGDIVQILCYYPAMSAENVESLRRVAGSHHVEAAHNIDEAIMHAPGSAAVLGFLPERVFAVCTSLQWFQSASAGMDQVLYPALVQSDVEVTNMAGLYARAGAEQAWALWLALARGLPTAMRGFADRRWQPFPVHSVGESTVLVLGMGGFGQEFVKRAAGYDLHILALDPVQESYSGVAEIRPPSKDNLHQWLPQVDAVICACPLTAETYHLIGARELDLMKPSAYLINVSRGGIVDEDALREALHAGDIAGAGLDVVEQEPLPPTSPLWEAPRLVVTPHRAGFSPDRHQNVVDFFCANVRRFVAGQPLQNVVDKRLGY